MRKELNDALLYHRCFLRVNTALVRTIGGIVSSFSASRRGWGLIRWRKRVTRPSTIPPWRHNVQVLGLALLTQSCRKTKQRYPNPPLQSPPPPPGDCHFHVFLVNTWCTCVGHCRGPFTKWATVLPHSVHALVGSLRWIMRALNSQG